MMRNNRAGEGRSLLSYKTIRYASNQTLCMNFIGARRLSLYGPELTEILSNCFM